MPDDTSPQEPPAQDLAAEDATAEEPTVATEAPAPSARSERKGVFVPRWLAVLLGLVLAVVLVGGGGFALGRATADDDHHDGRHARVEDRRPGGAGDRGDRQGGGPGSRDDRPSTPSTPSPRDDQPRTTGRVLLGVVVEPAGDGGTGARIVEVASGSPAADAGLESGDVITKVDDAAVDGPQGLASAIQEHADGDEVTLTYEREGTTATAEVTLAVQAQSSFPSTSPPA